MDIGIHLPSFTWAGDTSRPRDGLASMAAAAEEAGCHSISVMDHFFQMERWVEPVDAPMLEAYTALSYLAARTERVQLRALVTGVTYRHPGLLAKTVATLDVLSGGRAELGIGAAWYEREHRGLGVPFPPLAERFERLEETLRICLQMWSDDNGPFEGRHYQLAETLCEPQPLATPHPPILIGGKGERKTLRLVARYGDACNISTRSPDEVRQKLEVLRGHCFREGRDYDGIRKTVLYNGPSLDAGGADAFVEAMRPYADLGVDEVIVMPLGADAPEQVRRLGDVVPRRPPGPPRARSGSAARSRSGRPTPVAARCARTAARGRPPARARRRPAPARSTCELPRRSRLARCP